MNKQTLKDFQKIPGVGKAIAHDLWNLGFRSVSELKDKNPEKLYLELCEFQGCKVDRCMLYVFRYAIYFASNERHEKELLKLVELEGLGRGDSPHF